MKKPVVATIAGAVALVSIGAGGFASAMDKAITLRVDGQTQQVHVWGSTVEDALAAHSLELTPRDEVSPTTDTPIADGSIVEYDQETTTLSVNVGSGKVIVTCASAQVIASESVLLDTPSIKATGDLDVTGAITAGKDISTPGEIKAGAIGLKAHKHTAQGPTAPTTPAQA